MKPFSTPAWLCEKRKIVHKDGQEGILTLEGGSFFFKSKDETKKIHLSANELKMVDLSNIMAAAEIVLETNSGQTCVFVTTRPVSYAEGYSKVLFLPRLIANYQMFSMLNNSIRTSKKWRTAIIGSFPADKVLVRKEVRPWFVVVWSVLGVVIFLAVLFSLVILIANQA